VRSRKLALLAVPFLLLAILPGSTAAAGPAKESKAAHHARVVAYWTPARMKGAIPRDFTFDPVRGLKPNAKPIPNAKPTPGGGGSVTGASWTGGGDMLRGSGRVLFTLGGTDYICSGSVVNEAVSNKSIVLTAGHCAVDNDGTTKATNWVFIPSFDTAPTYTCANTTYGCWVADELYVASAFYRAGSFNNQAVQNDWTFAVVSGGGLSGTAQLDTTVGGRFGIAFSGVANGDTLSAFGYPAAGKYHGSDLVYCSGAIGQDAGTSNTTWSMPCNMTGGSSGGPWVSTTNTTTYAYGATTLRSLNSYGYSGVTKMFGPKFNSNTNTTYSDAVAGSPSAATVRVVKP
jgi:hypothetical protein